MMTDLKKIEIPHKRHGQTIVLHTVLPAAVTLILFAITIFYFMIPRLKHVIYEEKRQFIKDMTDVGYSLLEHYHQRVIQGELTLEESQRRVMDRMRFMRYGPEQKDYFWICDLEAKLMMHPYRPDLEGQRLLNYSDSEGNFFFARFVEIARTQKAGYAEYLWQWKDDPNYVAPKISYVRAFEPWGWILGTGIYAEDIRGQVAVMTRDLQIIFAGVFCVVLLTSLYLIGHGINVEMLRRKAEQQRQSLLEKLGDKNRQLQDFVYAVSHDLRAPLINIRGFSEELARSSGDLISHLRDPAGCRQDGADAAVSAEEEISESINFIRTNVKKMESLIDGLLSLSRVGSDPRTIEPVDMNEVLDSVRQVLHFQIKSARAQIKARPLPPCLADRNHINQVFCNLIDNALKYRHPDRDPEIQISGTSKQGIVEYTITDNGIGMEADKLDRIFDVFVQLAPASGAGGVGLGLTIVKRILELCGGTIQVRSQAGTGTTFIIQLPAP